MYVVVLTGPESTGHDAFWVLDASGGWALVALAAAVLTGAAVSGLLLAVNFGKHAFYEFR